MGRGYSFDALRVKLLLAPKKQGIITSYRAIRRKMASVRPGSGYMEFAMPSGLPQRDVVEKASERRTMTGALTSRSSRIDWPTRRPGGSSDLQRCGARHEPKSSLREPSLANRRVSPSAFR
ncbi:hypothetical protein THIX_20386 [Thiomonas sp. X19]|nr:hypothetical protein THIX_20386 [Thiomonas sp. X19]